MSQNAVAPLPSTTRSRRAGEKSEASPDRTRPTRSHRRRRCDVPISDVPVAASVSGGTSDLRRPGAEAAVGGQEVAGTVERRSAQPSGVGLVVRPDHVVRPAYSGTGRRRSRGVQMASLGGSNANRIQRNVLAGRRRRAPGRRPLPRGRRDAVRRRREQPDVDTGSGPVLRLGPGGFLAVWPRGPQRGFLARSYAAGETRRSSRTCRVPPRTVRASSGRASADRSAPAAACNDRDAASATVRRAPAA